MHSDTPGNRIKTLRINKGYSQERLADKAQLSLRTVQRIENGETASHGDTLTRLAKALDIDIAVLIERAEAPSGSISNNNYLALVNLLGLTICFTYLPLLSVIAPGVCWLIKRDSLFDAYNDGKKIINFQLTWSPCFYFCYYGFFFFKVQHLKYSTNLFQLAIAIIIFNIAAVLINTVRILNHKPVNYWLAIRFVN